MSILLVWHYYS